MKSSKELSRMEHQTSSIQTRSRRKRSARLKDTQEKIINESNNELIHPSKEIENNNQIDINNFQSIVDEFSLFISNINQIESIPSSLTKSETESEHDQYLQKRSSRLLEDENNEKISFRRSKRIKNNQILKNKQNKTKKKDIKKHYNELKVIDEENLDENKKKITSHNDSLETTKLENNEGNTQITENTNLNLPIYKQYDDMGNNQLNNNHQSIFNQAQKGNNKDNDQLQGIHTYINDIMAHVISYDFISL